MAYSRVYNRNCSLDKQKLGSAGREYSSLGYSDCMVGVGSGDRHQMESNSIDQGDYIDSFGNSCIYPVTGGFILAAPFHSDRSAWHYNSLFVAIF